MNSSTIWRNEFISPSIPSTLWVANTENCSTVENISISFSTRRTKRSNLPKIADSLKSNCFPFGCVSSLSRVMKYCSWYPSLSARHACSRATTPIIGCSQSAALRSAPSIT